MAPVVRISDAVFRRLQRIGEPLVDTASSVMERVLDHYERTQPGQDFQRQNFGARPQAVLNTPDKADFGLFLVPARSANLQATIEHAVPLSVAGECLPEHEYAALAAAVAPAKEFHCWATTETNRAVFSSMRPGDGVLITEKGTGRFDYRGRIVTTLI